MLPIIVVSILSVALTIVIGIYILSHLLLLPHRVSYDKTYKLGIQKGEINDKVFRSIRKEEVFIESYHGYKLHGMFFPIENSKKVIIIAHGITWSLFGSFKYVKMFQRLGYHVLLCDHRNHGLSEGEFTSYGYYEKYDLKAWIDYLNQRMGDNLYIGLLGESLGAASALEVSKLDKRVSFCIADCAFSDFSKLLRFKLRQLKLRVYPVIDMVSYLVKLRHGFSFPDISPIRGLEKTQIPILFIHGKEDTFIPKDMTIEMFRRKRGKKHIYLVPKAGHAEAYNVDPKGYEEKVEEFLRDVERLVYNGDTDICL